MYKVTASVVLTLDDMTCVSTEALKHFTNGPQSSKQTSCLYPVLYLTVQPIIYMIISFPKRMN